MATQNQNEPKDKTTQQGDNRKAGDQDGNRGARPKTGSQGVNESAANKPDGTKDGGRMPNPEPANGAGHSEAEALYRQQSEKN
jgi:hypothetical protein